MSKAASYTSLVMDAPAPTTSSTLASWKTRLLRYARPFLVEYHSGDKEDGKLGWYFMCPVHGKVAMWVTKIIAALAIWGTFWAITGEQALPGGNFFGLLLLIYGCVLAAAFINLTPFPPLLGMLIVGFCVRNAPGLDIAARIDKTWASTLRTVALVVILVRAGSGLDPKALQKVKWMAIRLAFVPSVFEAVAAAIVAHFAMGFPWIWAFIAGFVLSAVSPAVVVPSMIGVQERGFGILEGIPTLCIAACSLNDVFSISGFGVMLGIAFSNADLVYNIFHGPLEIIIGILFGVGVGVVLWYIPNQRSKNLLMYRFILIVALGMFATFGFRKAKFPGAGALGTLTMAFVAGVGWRKRGWDVEYPIKPILAKCWQVFQPLLFGLIGNAVSIDNLASGDVGLGIAMLFVGLVIRLIVTFFSAYGMNFSIKEKLFITIAWIPKATVQAAIGPLALDTARANGADENIIRIATSILTVAVLSILITAPIGATGIVTLAPFLLNKSENDDTLSDEEHSSDENQNNDKEREQSKSNTEVHKLANELRQSNNELHQSINELHQSVKELNQEVNQPNNELNQPNSALSQSNNESNHSNSGIHQSNNNLNELPESNDVLQQSLLTVKDTAC